MTPLFLLKPLADVHIIYIHIYDLHIIYIYIERYKYIDIDIDINRSIVVVSAMACFSSDTYIRKTLAESTSSAKKNLKSRPNLLANEDESGANERGVDERERGRKTKGCVYL